MVRILSEQLDILSIEEPRHSEPLLRPKRLHTPPLSWRGPQPKKKILIKRLTLQTDHLQIDHPQIIYIRNLPLWYVVRTGHVPYRSNLANIF